MHQDRCIGFLLLSYFQLSSPLGIVNALLSPSSGPIDLNYLPLIPTNLRNSETE